MTEEEKKQLEQFAVYEDRIRQEVLEEVVCLLHFWNNVSPTQMNALIKFLVRNVAKDKDGYE